jgi:hypothetical protein
VAEALITNFPLGVDCRRILQKEIVKPDLETEGIDSMLAKNWLLRNQYKDIAELIDEVTAVWKAQGKRTRRNWWQILAGDAKGNPRIVAGRKFPVLRAAQLRQGVPVNPTALCRSPDEEIPPVRITARWEGIKAENSQARITANG